MTDYNNFKIKWEGKSAYDNINNLSGKIIVYRDENFKPYHDDFSVIADIWELPTWHGWSGLEKERRKFMSELKKTGLNKVKGKKLTYYKIISICGG